MDRLNETLQIFIKEPKYPLYNFNLGRVYEDMGHTSSAVSYYLRTAELASNNNLRYESLLRVALCIEKQGRRSDSVNSVLLRAISFMPKRPEAYFLLSRSYEMSNKWPEAYAFASIGEKLILDDEDPLITDVQYSGKYSFIFQKAVSAWWIGMHDESIHLFKELEKNPNMTDIHKKAVANNLKNLSNSWKQPIIFDYLLHPYLKAKFNGSKNIHNNFSQCYQDMFVLTMLNGKRNGKFLEIGCGDPFYGNNSALLEKEFGWSGISIDIDKGTTDLFSNYRNSLVLCKDATKINYDELLKENRIYDYLQIDCDPPAVSYEVLLKIPFDTHKFAVITFEHDSYNDNNQIREKSRKFLESQGYELIVNNIAPDKYNSFEDWWVHPELVEPNIIQKMKFISDNPKKADDYMLDKIV